MLRVRLLSTALAIILTGACTTTGTGTATPAADQSLIAIPITTQSATARSEFLQGLRDFDAERFVDARHHFNAAVGADPNFALGHLYAAFDGGSLVAYRAHLDAAIATANLASPLEQLWIRAEQKGADNDVNGQIAIAEQIVRMTPNDPRAYGYLANAQFNANRRTDARATLERAAQINPTFVTTWIQFGNSYLVTEPRDIAKAHTYIDRAVALQPNEAVVHDYMGDVYRAENNLPQARAEYTRMAELSPTRGEAFQQRGHVNSFLGNYAEARADYDRAIMLSDPTVKPAYAVYRALVSVYAGDPAAAEAELDRVAANVDPSIPNATGNKIFALTEEARIALHNRHLALLITEILTFARVGSGRVSYALVDVKACDALQHAVELVEPLFGQKGLAFDGISGDTSIVARADPERVTQILVNLLSNAIKFTPSGGHISADCAATGDTVTLRVSDTGMGIASEKHETIFEPFIQLKEGLADRETGVGLGLAISRDLARALNGDLTVESTEGQGARFTLSLPRGGESAVSDRRRRAGDRRTRVGDRRRRPRDPNAE